jgi:putative glycosyltransferase (TIGR04348 family)
MRILIVTPAPPRSRKGNRITAVRWARILRELGHRVDLAQQFDEQPCDVLVALHARRSAQSIQRFHRLHPDKPLVLALTGTDLYGDIHRDAAAQRSLELASRFVLLQAHGIGQLQESLRDKARVIYQSVVAPRSCPPPLKDVFEVCVIGHLRDVKDPFRAALASRRLPASSQVRIVHMGAALSERMAVRARAEMNVNSRYRWLGELPHWKTQQRLARSRLLVLSSKMEGGANVISEAVAVSTPVVSSRISGSIGLLGEDYPGYFEVGDTHGLAELLLRAEQDSDFYAALQSRCRRLKPLTETRRERRSWQQLLRELTG